MDDIRAVTRNDRRPVLVLRGVLGVSVALAAAVSLVFASTGSDSRLRWAEGGVAVAAILATLLATFWPWNLTTPAREVARRAVAAGLLLGLLWTAEITMNNVLQPPLPWRDWIDDVFWALVAAGILMIAVRAARANPTVRTGVDAGVWAGVASGAVACVTALVFATVGTPLLRSDPLNVAEWAARRGGSATAMIGYFAYETLAGAVLHLVVLGSGMGAILGVLAGSVVKFTAAMSSIRRLP